MDIERVAIDVGVRSEDGVVERVLVRLPDTLALPVVVEVRDDDLEIELVEEPVRVPD